MLTQSQQLDVTRNSHLLNMKNQIKVSDLVQGMDNLARMRREIMIVLSGLQGRLNKLGVSLKSDPVEGLVVYPESYNRLFHSLGGESEGRAMVGSAGEIDDKVGWDFGLSSNGFFFVFEV